MTLAPNPWAVAAVIAAMNVPFGYWRAAVRKFSVPWFLAVHVPVPLAIGLRLASGLGWRLVTLPLFVAAFFSGQMVGGRVRTWLAPVPPPNDAGVAAPAPAEE